VRRVNCYLIDDDLLTLVDVGPAAAMSMGRSRPRSPTPSKT